MGAFVPAAVPLQAPSSSVMDDLTYPVLSTRTKPSRTRCASSLSRVSPFLISFAAILRRVSPHADVRCLPLRSERNGNITSTEKADLDVARAEIARLKKIKEDYVKANPEAADAVLPPTRPPPLTHGNGNRHQQQQMGRIQLGFRERRQAEAQGLRFDRNGRLLNPWVLSLTTRVVDSTSPLPPDVLTRAAVTLYSQLSAYFDPIFNPFGVPPPGLAYKARRKYTHCPRYADKLELTAKGIVLPAPTAEEIAARQAQHGGTRRLCVLQHVMAERLPFCWSRRGGRRHRHA